MSLPNTKEQITKRIVQGLFFLSSLVSFSIIFLLVPVKSVSGQYCPSSCDEGCSVGFVCVFDDLPGARGPATWECVNGCCNRPARCPGAAACHEPGYAIDNRINCAPRCMCTTWRNGSCGGGSCGDGQRRQTRDCTPDGCESESRCVDDSSCLEPTISPPVVITPVPPPYVPCDEVRYPEFHSLRPYQASPCDETYHELAFFCGNDFIVQDDVVIEKQFFINPFPVPWWSSLYYFEDDLIGPVPPPQPDGPPCSYCRNGKCIEKEEGYCIPSANQCELGDDYACIDKDNCIDNGDGTETCWFNIYHQRDIAIDLEGAYLPIMGNTELVVNSQDQPDPEGLDDGQKVNEYVSWYLNGIIGRAEYDPPDPDEEEGRKIIIDFSGPLKKLLSKDSQKEIRKDEIDNAEEERHNQIVVCTDLSGQPTPCYPDRSGVSERRMTNVPNDLYSYVPFSSTEDRMGRAQIYTYSVQPRISEDFVVLIAELIDKEPAELFFSHMQESAELAELLQQSFAPGGAALDKLDAPGYTPPSAFCDVKRIRSNPGDNLFAGEITATLEYDVSIKCDFLLAGNEWQSGENWGNLCRELIEGDADCIANGPLGPPYCETYYGRYDCQSGETCGINCEPWPTPPAGTLCQDVFSSYCVPKNWNSNPGCIFTGDATALDCSPTGNYECPYTASACQPPLPEAPPMTQECPKTVLVVLNTLTETPKIDEIWARLVAGPASVFKRIFPRIGEGGAVTGIWDIPGATPVVYETTGVTLAGNPASGRSGAGAELYFPHVGGLHEYFLHCIQTMLRPQGFGFECLTEGPPPWPENCPAEMWPVMINDGQKYYVNQGPGGSITHGPPDWPYQEAIDIHPAEDTSSGYQGIIVTHSGVVRQAGVDGWGGNYVQLEADCGAEFLSVYVHMDSLSVSTGDHLEIGDEVGPLGNTGYSSGAHLHYEFRNVDGTLKDRADPPPFMVKPYIPEGVPTGCVGRGECAVDIP